MKSGSRSGYAVGRSAGVQPPRVPPGPERDSAGSERIAALSALVDELSEQIDAIEGASRRGAIRRGVLQAAVPPEPAFSPAPERTEPPSRPKPDPQAERLEAIEKRLASIAEQIVGRDKPAEAPPAPRSARPAPEGIGSLQAAIAEISARQQAIDLAGGRQLGSVDSIALEDAILSLRSDIAALDRRIAAEARRGEEHGRSLRAEFAERLAHIPTDAGRDDAFAGLRRDIGEIRQAIELAARETTLASIESGYGHVIERLDEIVRRVPERERIDAVAQEIARLASIIDQPARPREIDGELEDIRNAIASFATRRPDDAIERQIAELHKAIERLADESRAAPDLSRIEERLDALAGRFDGSNDRRIVDLGLAIEKLASRPRETVDLSRIERDLGAMRREIDGFAKGTDPVLLLRLEQQVMAIREALDERGAGQSAVDGNALARLEERLDALAGRFDAIIDLPNRLAPVSGEALAGLRSEISQLRSDVSTHQPARFDEIETQMQGLVQRLDAAAGRDDSQALAQLEAQVGALADKLSVVEPGADALSKVEENLDRLQSLLGDTRRETIEAARDAARSTFQEYAGSLATGKDGELVDALREDLRKLQDAALRSDQQNQNTLEAVHDTLAKVVDRIAQLEAEETAASEATYAAIKARARGAIPPRLPASGEFPEDHRPLAPGSGKPDLTGPLTRVEGDAAARQGDRKADFIAAARRAAQAAQAETAKVRIEEAEAEQESERPGPLARIGQALRSRRRPLVLAITAVVLALGAAQLGPALQQRIVDALAPTDALDRTATGSIPAKPIRQVEANRSATPARAAAPTPSAPAPIIAAAQPELVAPKTNNTAVAFDASDPFADYLALGPVAAPAAAPVAAAAPTLDIAMVETAASKGNAVAAFELAKAYAEGVGAKADVGQAAQWYARAAKGGIALAQYRLGSLYERGEGVKLDAAAAQGWYEKASAQGNARATHNLAVLISEGAAGQPDYKKAAELFIAAADLGVADSQYNLGVLYARGLGVPVDLVQSYKWFALAAQQGDADAGKRRDEVAKAMKADDLAAARAAVQAFQPKPLDAAANSEPAPKAAWFRVSSPASMVDTAAPAAKQI